MQLQPGDVFFTSGGGLIAALIRFFTSSPVAHTGIVVAKNPDGTIVTHEAFWPSGLSMYVDRDPKKMKIQRVYRVWRNDAERQQMIEHSTKLVGKKYDLFEIFRICIWGLNKFMLNAGVLFTALAISVLMNTYVVVEAVYFGILVVTFILKRILKNDNADKIICSNHIAMLSKYVDPELELTHPTTMIWPGRLEQDLHLHQWRL